MDALSPPILPEGVLPVKLVLALLHGPDSPLTEGLQAMQEIFGPLDHRGEPQAFGMSDYYEREMGGGLKRFLVGFERLVDPGSLAWAKVECRRLEGRFAKSGSRSLNLDVGYLDLHKLVLASFKHRGNKIYLSQGVWADWSLSFEKGSFVPMPWCFPDFSSGAFDRDLLEIRKTYKIQLKAGGWL